MKNILCRGSLIVVCFLIGIYFTDTPQNRFRNNPEAEEAGESNALKSFEWWYAQRALPYDFIPHDGFQKATRYLKSSMIKERNVSLNGVVASSWTSIGPINIGGRALAIAVNPTNPNIVWAGSASGGLWKSTTGGVGSPAWSYVNTGLNVLSVSAISLDPSNPQIIYIGTGEISLYHRPLVGTPGARASYGMGIIKSTDGGSTWLQTGLTWTFPEITAVQKIAINQLNPKTIFAATSEGVFKSIDAGVSWKQSNSVPMAMDIAMSPADTSTLFSAHGNLNSSTNPGLYKTTNAGATWIQLTNGLPNTDFGRTSLAISPSNPSVIYAGISDAATSGMKGLYKSTDNGASWSLKSSTNYVGSQGWYDNVIAVHPNNPDTIFCAGLDIYKSIDGGANLTAISTNIVHVDQHAIAFDPTNTSVMYFGNDGGMYNTTNGGQTFYNCNNGFITTQFYPGFANAFSDSTIALGGLQDNGTLKYTGTSYWTQIFGADGGWCAIDPTNSNIIYYEYQWLQLLKSTNGGANVSSITIGLPSGTSNTNFIAPFVISSSSPNVLYAGCNNVYKTTNGGNSWFVANGQTTLNGTNIAAIAVSRTNPDTLIASTGSGALGVTPKFEVFSSINGGQLWTNVTYKLNGTDSLPNRYPTDIEFDPTNSSTAYLTYSGYGTPHVFKTTNIGMSWINISSNLPDIPHQSVCVDSVDPVNIYVGTDLGVFHTSNNGTTWEEFNNGMPPAMVLDLTISRANNKLRASTFGNGVYERPLVRIPILYLTTPNGGENWATGYPENILWSEKFLDYVKLEYTIDNGIGWSLIADSIPASQGSYSWILPMVASTQARVRISAVGNSGLVDTSDGLFTIVLNANVFEGWNLLSLHVKSIDPRTITLFPTAISQAFFYNGSYIASDSLFNGVGYWIKFSMPQIIPITGDSIKLDTINVKTGWNMIGSISKSVAKSNIIEMPPNIVVSDYYSYKLGYNISDSIKPRSGYWVKVNSDGKLVLSSTFLQKNTAEYSLTANRSLNTLTISDNSGCRQTLYFTADGNDLQVNRYELPPPPPDGAFDIRFTSQRMLEIIPENLQSFYEKAILISSSHYPITLNWIIRDDGVAYKIVDPERNIIPLAGSGTLQISRHLSHLILNASKNTATSPVSFRLEQNYPNPFNPSTVINYQIPTANYVTLKVYNIQGKEVATLVDGYQTAGYKSIEWNANNLASSVYYYKLMAGNFVDVKKMILLK